MVPVLAAKPALALETEFVPALVSSAAPVIAVIAAVSLALACVITASSRLRRSERRAERAERRFGGLLRRLERAESLLAAEPGAVLVWPLAIPGEISPKPFLFGRLNGLTMDEHLARGANDIYGCVRDMLPPQEGDRLDAAVGALRGEGATFALSLTLADGASLEVQGRPAGGQAVLWLRDGSAERAEIERLGALLAEGEAERALVNDLLDRMPMPVWRRNAVLDLVWVNRAYAEAVDAEASDRAVDRQAELDGGTRRLAHSARREQSPQSLTRPIVIDGERRVATFVEAPLGEGSFGVALDATALDESRQELARHQTANRDTLDALHTAVAIFGPDKALRFFNRAYADLWLLDPDWLAGGPKDGEILEILREQRKLPEQANFPAWKRKRLALYNKVIDEPEEQWHLPDGRALRVVCRAHPYGGLIYLYEDVTDRLALESSLKLLVGVQRATLDNLYEGIALFGSDGRLKLFNPAFARIWSFEPGDLEGEPHFGDIAQGFVGLLDDKSQWEELAARVTSLDPERRTKTGRFERNDGAVIDYAATPLPDGACLLSFLDVTDTTRIERALRERNDALEAADHIKSGFVSHVSYQLRTPLNTIIGYSTMLDKAMLAEPLTDRQKEYVGNIREAGDQLLRLIDDILDLATIEAGRLSLDLTEVDVARALEGAAGLARKRAQESRLAFGVEVAPDVGSIVADERRIKQVVFNLLQNAIAFTPPGGRIRLAAERSGAEIRISVRDTGEGIAPKAQASVFDRFESRGADGRRGAGLGLSLVRSIVQLHGGWVELQSTLGKGTTVTCHLPERARLAVDADRDAAE